MCPGIGLYDFRILSPHTTDTEFAVIAALQFIRYLNQQAGFQVINGVNISLSIRHDVRNYACGGTPVCGSVRLVDSGVAVVAAAGNLGYQHNFRRWPGTGQLCRVHITDPAMPRKPSRSVQHISSCRLPMASATFRAAVRPATAA